ncbi:ABC transporter ATP-binding protein [Alkaliphilus transvaalensis]|uniref:ABC transporter ATP-binding protein n=1 Tax=Alkaliphilus transvaalensis TaxID=114628 RepID=UPI000686624E|nr:ABC transporter ATP-binding protein [Alkaliphilus transvaalensis]
MEKIIEVSGIYRNFQSGMQSVNVLKDINFTVNKGDFVSIMGPSGSGKSTLLYIIGGLDQPTSGEIKLNGKRNIANLNDKEASIVRRRDIGFVFQFYNLIPDLNVEENVLLPVLLDGKKKKDHEEYLGEILNEVGLYDRKKFRPKELSGGQQQRVAIARALINNPEIILADEPIGNLDSKVGMDIMNLFRSLNLNKGKTIIQVTHSRESSLYGNRIIHLKDGEIEEQENLKKEVTNYENKTPINV